MTGYRLGYIAANVEVAKACEKLQGQFTSGTNAVTQRAAIDALVGDQAPTVAMTKEFERRKKRVMELMDNYAERFAKELSTSAEAPEVKKFH